MNKFDKRSSSSLVVDAQMNMNLIPDWDGNLGQYRPFKNVVLILGFSSTISKCDYCCSVVVRFLACVSDSFTIISGIYFTH